MKDKKVLLRLRNLKQYFPVGKKRIGKPMAYVKANDGITIDIYEGETLGIVGESGCGKSTLGRTILELYRQTDGSNFYYGREDTDIDVKYIEEIFNNLPKEKKICEELLSKKKKMKEELDKLPKGPEKKIKSQQLREVEFKAENKLFNITSLIGGIYALDNLEEVSKLYKEEYNLYKELRSLKNKINKLEIQNYKGKNRTSKDNSDEIDSLDNKIEEINKKIDIVKEKIGVFRKEAKTKENFELYESYKTGGINLASLKEEEMRVLRKDLQMIFQDPYSSLDPRMTLGQIIGEGIYAHGLFEKGDPKAEEYIIEIMEQCGLSPYFIHRYPHQFSGGQRQRIGIARALSLKPKFLVCDEAVSALDVSIQSQIINLLLELKEKNNLTYMFISHDLSVIKYISDRIGVMYLGNLVEIATSEQLFAHQYHPYTEALLSAIPTVELDDKKETIVLEGDIPSPINPPKGCKFHTRCRYKTDICSKVRPELVEVEKGHFVACHNMIK